MSGAHRSAEFTPRLRWMKNYYVIYQFTKSRYID